MSSIFTWIKEFFNFGQGTAILREKINDEKSKIPDRIKQDLLMSIRTNDPEKLYNLLQDQSNGIPDNVREELKVVISSPVIKCLVVGDAGVGKTTLVSRHQTGVVGNAKTILFKSNRGPVEFHIWETMADEEKMDCSIVMFDLTCLTSCINVQFWYRVAKNACGGGPIVLVGSRDDRPNHIDVSRDIKINYYKIGAQTTDHLEEPFLELARQVLHDDNLMFIT
jgi:hypothetical protein